MSFRILIVDDEPLARERIRTLLGTASDVTEVLEAADGDAAVRAIREERPDAVFLDVQMPARDGFGVIATVGAEQMPPVVFVTAFDAHALQAFEVHAVDYLLKPFDDQRFRDSLDRVRQQRTLRAVATTAERLSALLADLGGHGAHLPPSEVAKKRWMDRVLVRQDGKSTVVKLADVTVIESEGNYVHLHVGRTKHVIRETLSHLESQLDPERFLRIHRRLIVNIEAIQELQPWFGGDQVMILRDGSKLRVSRNYREKVVERLSGLG